MILQNRKRQRRHAAGLPLWRPCLPKIGRGGPELPTTYILSYHLILTNTNESFLIDFIQAIAML